MTLHRSLAILGEVFRAVLKVVQYLVWKCRKINRTNTTEFALLVGSFRRWAPSERLPNAQCTHSQHGGNMAVSSSSSSWQFLYWSLSPFCLFISVAETWNHYCIGKIHLFVLCILLLNYGFIILLFLFASFDLLIPYPFICSGTDKGYF